MEKKDFPQIEHLITDPIEDIRARLDLCKMAIITIQSEIKQGREDTENALDYYKEQKRKLNDLLNEMISQAAKVQTIPVQGSGLDDQKPKPVIIGLKPAVLTIKTN